MLQKLAFEFNAALIRSELTNREHTPHFMPEFAAHGNSALLLVTTRGEQNHEYDAPMLPTPALENMPYTKSVWGTLGIPFIRARFMTIAPGGESPQHKDAAPWWQDRLRIHIPVQTSLDARFIVGEIETHLPEGSCWIVDTANYYHAAVNRGSEPRTHLVIDVDREYGYRKLINNV